MPLEQKTAYSGEILFLRNPITMEPSRENGCAALVIEDNCYHLYALFSDSDIFNDAKQDNDKTWRTGDVCEFFVQPGEHDDYFEFHATPDNIRLQLHLPPIARRGSIPFEQQIFDSGLKTSVRVDRARNLWYIEMTVPFAGLGITHAQAENSRFSVCRYNYTYGVENPEKTL